MAETAPCYAGGQWSQIPDFLGQARADGRTLEDALKAVGFSSLPWSVIGDEGGLTVPLSLKIFTLVDLTADKPHFLAQIQGNGVGDIPHVFAQTLPDVMELLSRWAPAVQSAAVTEAVVGVTESQYPATKWDTPMAVLVRQFLS